MLIYFIFIKSCISFIIMGKVVLDFHMFVCFLPSKYKLLLFFIYEQIVFIYFFNYYSFNTFFLFLIVFFLFIEFFIFFIIIIHFLFCNN